MKRYDTIGDDRLLEDEDGEWVRHVDVVVALASRSAPVSVTFSMDDETLAQLRRDLQAAIEQIDRAALAATSAPAEPSDNPERDEFYRVFNESEKLTGHKPTLFDIWLMARGRMDTSHRTIETIDLWHEAYKQLQQAASESNWIPPEYYANDWIADCCRWLREGPPVAEVEERRELSDYEVFSALDGLTISSAIMRLTKSDVLAIARAILKASQEKAS